MSAADPVTYKSILHRAWPLILANSSVPLLGLADTAVLGNVGNVSDLGAIALGALIFSFVYWGFGFLRMGTTGFVAQACGAGDELEVRTALVRSLVIAVVLGAVVIILQLPLSTAAFGLFQGSAEVESIASVYFHTRIWGAPATLATFALVGALIGLGESRKLLLIQLFLNGLNIILDIWFAGYLQLGAEGVALGTLIAEWVSLGFASYIVIGTLKQRQKDTDHFVDLQRVFNKEKLLKTISANVDIMVRTLLLVFAFAWFTNQSARYGDVVLAANHILLQIVSFSAFFLDGFAFVAEAYVGQAMGAGRQKAFDLSVRKTTALALLSATILAFLILLGGQALISLLSDIDEVNLVATSLLYLSAIYVFLSFPAFQLDGIFIGATRTKQMRTASFVSIFVFLLSWWMLTENFGVVGLWWAFIIYVCARALALLYFYAELRRSIPDSGQVNEKR
jgi:MATE family multidrug resistance protein